MVVLRVHDLRQSLIGRIDAVHEFLSIQPTYGMIDDEELGLHFPRSCLSKDERGEGLGGNDVSGYAALFEFDAVVETPR